MGIAGVDAPEKIVYKDTAKDDGEHEDL